MTNPLQRVGGEDDDLDYSPGLALFAGSRLLREIESLKEQLGAAHKHIHDLQKELADKTCRSIAEKPFGLPEPLPPATWLPTDGPIQAPSFVAFRKTNTQIMESCALVADELTAYHACMPGELERQIKDRLMAEMFCQMQAAGIFRQFQRKALHETVYVVAVEVAKP